MTPGSARVDVSPRSSSSLAIFRKTRRMILPERVLGNPCASYEEKKHVVKLLCYVMILMGDGAARHFTALRGAEPCHVMIHHIKSVKMLPG